MAVKLFSLCLLALLGSLSQAQTTYFKPNTPSQPQKPQQSQNPWNQHQSGQKPQTSNPTTQQTSNPGQSSCEVAQHYKIQCGLPDISANECEALNCCYDGQMCFYGRAVTLQCTKDGQFIVVIARDATLPNIDLESIHFNDASPSQSCQPVGSTSAFVIYQFSVSSCGTSLTEEPENNLIIYENRISSSYEVAVGPYGAITRDSQFDLLIQCRYVGASVQALVVDVKGLDAPPNVAAPGSLRVELRLGNGQCTAKGCMEEDVAFNSYYDDMDYPITKVLRDPVYVEVRILDRTDPNIVLTLGRCWATSKPEPFSYPQWDLLVNGCPYVDDRYQTALAQVDPYSGVQFPTHYRRFIFKMFTFVATNGGGSSDPTKKNQQDPVLTPMREMVYIHCNTAVCQPTAQDNCQPRCSRRRRDVSALVKSDSAKEATTVTSQGIVFVQPSDDNAQ